MTVTKLPSSIPTAQLKAGLAAEAKDPGHKVVSGLGDYALVGSVIPPNAEVKVLVGHLLLDCRVLVRRPVGQHQAGRCRRPREARLRPVVIRDGA